MSTDREIVADLYEAFNAGEFERVIAMMTPDVKWANGMEGGFVHGREEVREYWRKQFGVTRSHLNPLNIETDATGRNVVTVEIIVSDLEGKILLEKTLRQIFTIENGLVSLFEIEGSEPMNLMQGSK